MAPKNLVNPLDPTLIFAFASTLSVLFVQGDEEYKRLDFKLPGAGDVLGYVGGPAFLIALAVLALAMAGVQRSEVHLTRSESLAANWYLWNAVVFHLLLDGFGGVCALLPLMNENYRLLDRRYRPELIGQSVPGAPLASDRAIVAVLNYMEIFVHTPLTLLSFWGVCHRSPWRQTVEAMALTVQMMGALLFGVPDLLTGCENFQPMGVKDCTPPLDLFHFFYVYFGQLANYVWVLVPAVMLVKVVRSDIAEKRWKHD